MFNESESALELLLIEPENKIMGEKDENFPKVSITSEDIARIAIAVKDVTTSTFSDVFWCVYTGTIRVDPVHLQEIHK
jgi:hypothetical protein